MSLETAEAEAVGRLSPERRRAIIEARVQRLAGGAPDDGRTDARRVLVCPIGANLFGIDMEAVSRIRPFAKVGALPSRAPASLGLVADGGRIRQAFDLGALIGGASPAPGGWLISLAGSAEAAFRIEALPEIADVQPAEDDTGQARVLGGAYGDRILVMLEAEDLLARAHSPVQGADRR